MISILLIAFITIISTIPVYAETSSCTVTADATKGSYNKELEAVPEVPPFSWEDSVTIIVPIIATEEDIKDVEENNKTLTAKIEINRTDYEEVKEDNPSLYDIEKEFDYCVSMDIKFTKIISDDANKENIIRQEEIHELSEKITLTFEAPGNYDPQKQEIDYTMIRIHDGVSEELELTYNEADHTLSFKTDRFSDYIFYYTVTDIVVPQPEKPQPEKKPETNNTTTTNNNQSNNNIYYNDNQNNYVVEDIVAPPEEPVKKAEKPKKDNTVVTETFVPEPEEVEEEVQKEDIIEEPPSFSNGATSDPIPEPEPEPELIPEDECMCKWCFICSFLCSKKETCKCMPIIVGIIAVIIVVFHIIFKVKDRNEEDRFTSS